MQEYIIRTKSYLIEAVAKMLKQELPILTADKFTLFQTTGNRLIYETEYFAKRKFLTVFGVAAQWMKQEKAERLGSVSQEKVLQKLEEILVSVCEEECWALPAHVNPSDRNWRNTIDLFAAETAQTLSDMVDVLEADLSNQCVGMVKENVQRRVLQPFFETEPGTYGWEVCDNNWNAVCNGNIGSAYLHSLKDGEAPKPQYLKRICENFMHYINGFAEDGTCTEGLGYYFYGMTYFVNLAMELYEKTNGVTDLLCGDWGSFKVGEDDKRCRMAEWWSKCFFRSGRTVSFSDGDSRDKYRIGLACALAERFTTVQLPNVRYAMLLEEDPCYRYLPFKMDLFCTMHYLEKLRNQEVISENLQLCSPEKPQQGRCTILKDAQWCIAEAVLHAAGFACKGGHNGESHNHNDVGSFLYVADGEMFLADLGAGEYTREYFGAGRYDILCNRSLGHNVPLVGGLEQLAGAEYGCRKFQAEEDEEWVKISMDLKEAYGRTALNNLQRSIIFHKESGKCVLRDEFASDEEITVTENLVTQILPQIKSAEVWLQGRDKLCKIQIKPTQVPRIITKEHRNHQGNIEQVYLIQWDVIVKNSTQIEIDISI